MSKHLILMSIVSLLPAALLRAQNSNPPVPAAPAVQKAVATEANTSDAILATWLVIANDNEIALANLALKNAQGKDVQQFARQMIEDHSAFATKLRPFTGSVAATDRKNQPIENGSGVKAARPTEASGTGAAASAFDHQALLGDVGKQCLASATRMLGEQKGTAFDHAFMQQQVAGHVMMADLLEVFGKHASTELRPTLVAGLATVRGHLDHAKMLCAQAGKVAQGDATRPDSRGNSGSGK
jgi:predicted outer membrane protein